MTRPRKLPGEDRIRRWVDLHADEEVTQWLRRTADNPRHGTEAYLDPFQLAWQTARDAIRRAEALDPADSAAVRRNARKGLYDELRRLRVPEGEAVEIARAAVEGQP